MLNAIQASTPIAQIVADHPACAKLLTQSRIDFCCHGDLTLVDASAARGIEPDELAARLRAAASSEAPDAERPIGTDAATSELIAYLVSRHHAYLRRTLPALCASRVASSAGAEAR